MSIDRTHFVYRVFDDRDLLLYVGCTKDLDRRYKQHRYNEAPWFPYATRFRLEGPFTRTTGFERENEVIEFERPYFNVLSAQKSVKVRRGALERRLTRELRAAKPHLFGRGGPISDELNAGFDRIAALVDATYPKYDKAWLLQNYLQARIARKAIA